MISLPLGLVCPQAGKQRKELPHWCGQRSMTILGVGVLLHTEGEAAETQHLGDSWWAHDVPWPSHNSKCTSTPATMFGGVLIGAQVSQG